MGLPESTPPVSLMPTDGPESDFDSESYFFKTYVPLSSLPTPPLSSHSRSGSNHFPTQFPAYPGLDSTLLGPSIHLANLIPSAASLLDPSTEVVNSVLVRASLPIETLALACCILDSLNSRFARSWRQGLPLHTTPCSSLPQSPLSSTFDSASTISNALPHIDTIRPEVIILSALIIADKFLNDQQAPTSYYSTEWAEDCWSCEMINATELAIMANLNYRILPLVQEEVLAGARDDMERAGWCARRGNAGLFGGKAVLDAAGVLTPALTPLGEECPEQGGGMLTGMGLGINV